MARLRSLRSRRLLRNRPRHSAFSLFSTRKEKLAKAMFPSCGSWWSFLLVLSVPSSEFPCLATTSTGAFAPLHVFLLAVASKFSEAQAQRSTSRRLAPPVRGSSRAEGPFFRTCPGLTSAHRFLLRMQAEGADACWLKRVSPVAWQARRRIFRKNAGLAQSFVFEAVTLVAGKEV